MKFTIAAAAALAALFSTSMAAKTERTFAVLHFTNKQLTSGRMDPIVSPNKVSSHVHSVQGGSNFGIGSTGEELMKSNCSTARVKGDNSNYWYPQLYFHDPKTGEFESVDIDYTNVYYFFEPTNDDIKAFPVGMSMVSGDAMTRVAPASGGDSNMDPAKGPISAAKITCPRLNNVYDPPSWPAGSDGTKAGIGDSVNLGEGVGFPDMDCNGLYSPLRADVHFPSCYNPKAGLTNYKENMAWPSDNNGMMDCPKGYIHVPHLFFEVYWNTNDFVDRWDQNSGTQPFVFANGDVTGYSSHADFMAAWDEDLLQHIIDTCNVGTLGMETCAGLTYGTNEDECSIKSAVHEEVYGAMKALPGDNPLSGFSYGPLKEGGSGGDDSTTAVTKPTETTKSAQKSTKVPDTTSTMAVAVTTEPGHPEETEPATTVVGHPAKPSSETAAAAATTKIPAKHSTASKCDQSVKTVYETVTVTAEAAVPTEPSANSTTAGGFKYAGCFKDTTDRVLSGETMPDIGAVSNEKCVTYCKKAGFALAGTEYGGQCYCGNELVGSKTLDDSDCDTKCEGDASDTCGGSWALSVFSADGEASMKSAKVRRHSHQHLSRHRGLHH